MIGGQDARRAALRAALERLPLAADVDLESSLDALQLGCYFASVNELPRMTSSRKKNAVGDELTQFRRLAVRLHRQVSAMHMDSVNALYEKGEAPHPIKLQMDLEATIRRADEQIARAPETTANTSPRKLTPEQTAQLCAQMYEDLTDKPAGLHWNDAAQAKDGPFLRFVQDVFTACGIDASAEHYARQARGKTGPIGGNGGITITRVPNKLA